jgi:hypothetical protein
MANEINIGINTTSDLSGLNKVDESVKSLKTQLKEAQANVAALSDTFGATSKQAVEAARSAAILKDKIGDAKSLTDAFNPDAKFKALSGSLTGVAGGFSAVTGVMGLMGKESKDVEAAILKVQSAMALASGVQALGESIDSFKQLGAVIKSTTIYQRIATTAQYLWNAAMAANPIGATIVAITALIGVGYLLISMFQKSKPTIDLAAEALKKHTEATKKNNEEIKKSIERKKEDEEYQYRLMKAQGIGEITILKTAVANAKATQSIANKNYQTAHEIALAEYLEIIERKKLAAQLEAELQQTKSQGGWTLNVDARIEKNKEELKSIQDKYKIDNETNKLRVQDINSANAQVLASQRNLNVALAQENTDKNKKQSEEQKKTNEEAKDEQDKKIKEEQEKKKEARLKEEQRLKEQKEKDKNILSQSIKEREDMEADSATKKAILQHTRRVEEINGIKDLNLQKKALEEENIINTKRMADAMDVDKEAEYNKSVEYMNLEDGDFESSLQKQLEHYEHLKTIQEDYGKSTIEIDKQIKKTKEDINKESYDKELELLNSQYPDLENDLVKKEEYNKKLLALQKLYGEKTIETEKAVKKTQEEIDKEALDKKAASIDAIGKMVVGAAEIGNFIADRLKENAGKDKDKQKTAVRVGAASSIAGVIGSTAAANAGFLANPGSIATMGLAAATPIALNIASSLVAIGNIVSQKNKAIAEIDNAGSGDSGGGKSTPSKFATGGLVQGMGTSTSDSIMANLSNGESVINAKSTAMFGNLLSQINQAGGGVGFGTQSQANPIFKTYVVASEMTSQIEANLKLKQIARL